MSTVLVVCTGNVCRSPLAEVVLRRHPGLKDLTVGSAGTRTAPDQTVCERAQAFLEDSGYGRSLQRPRPLTPQLLDEADLVLVAAYEHRAAVALLQPMARRKTFTLKEAGLFVQSIVAAREICPQSGTHALDESLKCIVRQMNDMRGAGQVFGVSPRPTVIRGQPSVYAAHVEIADGHWGKERAHRKAIEEVVIASQALGAGLAALLSGPH